MMQAELEILKLKPLQKDLVELLEREGPLKRDELVKHLQRARTTIYDNLAKLIKRRLITSFSFETHQGRGRPTVYFSLRDE